MEAAPDGLFLVFPDRKGFSTQITLKKWSSIYNESDNSDIDRRFPFSIYQFKECVIKIFHKSCLYTQCTPQAQI